MSEKLLTKEISEQFLADEGSVDLSEFTTIEDDAAEVLGKFDDNGNRGLSLSGIKHLSESTARHLSNFKRDIDISGLVDPSEQLILTFLKNSTTLKLKQISDEFAKTLSKRRSLPCIQLECFPALPGHLALAKSIVKDSLYLNAVDEVERIVELHPEIAKAFAQSPAVLPFAAVNDVSVSAAEALATHKKGVLWLSSVESVSEDVAKVLSKHGPKLFLNLTSVENTKGHKKLLKKLIKSQNYAEFQFEELPMWLAEEILNNLTKAKYDYYISFPCLTSIDLDVLRLLCGYKPEGHNSRTDLELDGLAELPEGAAEAISSHSGRLSLKGVTNISDAVAESLGRLNGDFNVSGLTQLSSVGAEHLAKSGNDLYLNGLVEVDADVAEALSRHTGDKLILDGVKSMSLSALQALTRYVGELSLGVTTLDAEQAEVLSCHQNELIIDYVTHLDTSAAKCLAKHRRLISMKSLRKLPLDAAKELAQHPGPIRVVLEQLSKKSVDLLKKAFPNELGCTLRK
jgi:hypothetical protein